MKAQEIQFLEFLKNAQQFRIPIYQRTYSWTDRECLQIWDDILRVGEDRGVSAHFIGSVVYIQEGIHSVGSAPYLVIDGQQRLTTVTLILEALARFVGDGEPVSGFSAEEIRNYYLKNHMESGEGQHKLLLTQTDRNTLLALVNQKELPRDHSVRLVKNFAWIEKRVKRLGGELENLCMGLSKLIVVGISLDRDHDNPQLIFESMNSTGRELSQADLIRNFILMGLGPNHQEELFENVESVEVIKYVNNLPSKAQMVLKLYTIEGYAHQEIATALNISVGTSKSQLSRAKHLLRGMINPSNV